MNAGEVLNTPGYYYAIAYAMSELVIAGSNEKKLKGWKLGAVSCIQFALLLLFMTWTHGVGNALFLPAMVVIIGLIYFYIYITNQFTAREAGFFCVKAFINGEFAASLCWQIFYYIHELTGCRFWWEWVIVAAAVFGMSNLSYLDQNGLFSGRFAMDIFIIRTLVDLSGMAVLYAYHIQVKEMQLRLEKDALRNIMEMQYKNYQLSRESIDVVNQKYHDLKHQINLLRTQADTGKAKEYLDKMEHEIKVYETQNKTGNPILDAVLTNKSLVCQKKEIELKVIMEGQSLSFMEDMDISALFGNMLDNAIESVSRQKEKEKRLIWLYVSREKQFVRIRTENYCDEKIQFRNGMPVTTKKDRRLHGYGMKSICATVEKYGGSTVACQKDNWFELKILIPIRDQENAGRIQ